MENTITLGEYINKIANNGRFVIPTYQRGYIWGQVKKSDKTDSVTYLLNTLMEGFKNKQEIFLQGITVCENYGTNNKDIVIVDGQQRTTFFYLLLKYLGYAGYISINYEVRKNSNEFLQLLKVDQIIKEELSEDEPYQDIYFFKKTLLLIDAYISSQVEIFQNKLLDFLTYILTKVKFLYIPIPIEKATIVFCMMNGNKALMLDEELIKSELLRSASLQSGLISEAENTAIRSRLAREWDAWLYWWNEKDHQRYFHISSQLGWLLPIVNQSEDVSFQKFKDSVLKDSSVRSAKLTFKKIRLLQNSIEDAYNNPILYNMIGGILYLKSGWSERFIFLKWYFDLVKEFTTVESLNRLRRYYDWTLIGMNHSDITKSFENDSAKENTLFIEMRDDFREKLSSDQLFRNYYEVAARWLLHLNIEEDSKQESGRGRKFDFEIWKQRSLEHIYPKSKVGHLGDVPLEKGKCYSWEDTIIDNNSITLWREDIKFHPDGKNEITASEHSIGNLVLLYKDENSSFGAKEFEEKKSIFFRCTGISDNMFKSRHLIHTVSVFANSVWSGEDIARNQYNVLAIFDSHYHIDNQFKSQK